MDNTQEYTCLSLCSGYGGLELGLKRACPNVRTVAYVEVEVFAVANLVNKMEQGLLDAAPVWTDIKTFKAEPFRDRIYIVTAGYPCQPFSLAGKRQGTDDPRHLWPFIERIIEAVRPVWFFGENVAGHLSLGYPTVYRSLRNMGYSVEAGLFTAAECGAPHRRKRLFILAHTTDNGLFGTEEPRSTKETICNTEKGQNNPRNPQRTDKPCKLADTTAQRIQGAEPDGTAQTGRQANEQGIKWPARPGQSQYGWEEPRVVSYSKGNRQQRPRARMQTNNLGKLLQEEPTKVVADTGKKQTGRLSQTKERQQNREAGSAGRQRQTKSRLGRAVDGTAYPLDIAKGIKGGYRTKPGGRIGHYLIEEAQQRTDRLRLLGNGVVPQQAEKAFRYLMAASKPTKFL